MTPDLEKDLTILASEVGEFDQHAAERLKKLAVAVSPGGDPSGWAGIDVIRAIDPPGTAAAIRDTFLVSRGLAWMEFARNLLALLPVVLTWVGLMYAAIGYHAAIVADEKNLLTRPFLLLWEERFHDHAPWPLSLLNWLTFSHVALGDVVILSLVVVLTWRIHRERNVDQVKHEERAHAVERRLHHLSWRASLVLSERISQAAIADQFRHTTERLLDELRAERERIAQLAAQREREVADLKTFAKGLKNGTSDLLRFAGQIRAKFDLLTNVSATLDKRIAGLEQTEHHLEGALTAMVTEIQNLGGTQRIAGNQLHQASRLLVDASEKGTIATAGVTRSVSLFHAELGELRQQLVNERQAYELATQKAEQAAIALAQAAQQAAQIAPVMQDLLKQLTGIPSQFQEAFRQQQTAAGSMMLAAQQIATAVATTDVRLLAVADTLDSLVPTFQSLTTACVQLQRQASAVIASAPTTETLTDALRMHQIELVDALHAALDGSGSPPKATSWWRGIFRK
jgi:hypothetical protein